jgi:hypothetical protein
MNVSAAGPSPGLTVRRGVGTLLRNTVFRDIASIASDLENVVGYLYICKKNY